MKARGSCVPWDDVEDAMLTALVTNDGSPLLLSDVALPVGVGYEARVQPLPLAPPPLPL